MKKNNFKFLAFATILGVLLLTTGCSSDDDNGGGSGGPGETNERWITIAGAIIGTE